MIITDLLKQIPLFESMADVERQQLSTLLQRRQLRKGGILFRKGDKGSAFFIIIKGLVKISVSSKLGDEVTLALLRNGDFFGEMALLDEQPRSADAVALEDSLLYVLDRNDFFPFLFKNENAVRSILRALSLRLRRADDLFTEISFLTVPARLAKRLVELAEPLESQRSEPKEYKIRMSQRELASMLGVTRESINKELKILKDKGLVETSRNSILIRDIDRLKRRTR
ncbi:Crp-like helix-turn-helix domain-containing protein [Syntrophus gentianae]|uniref:Crp-like helix-turn-helix domain-containing protein n=1 Tax=Syntrophus gentianae TaxID=43775 RepID=A0A1H7Z625_9BACT|nr:Crp/Fnr family transcriptional regulator [Syntrophus gentianae]SEM52998.1 Crp-like helix-turn-helix domain-containing protein [Syntrophus gentianae]